MDINTLARKVAMLEGKKRQVNIAQIKEILSCLQKIMKGKGTDFYSIVHNLRRN